ncbi:MAG: regulatory protein RecX [Verrucomicrobia bacterium]|nr:regulatory protein RecX [Verrucomicrobiota bacterium]
MNIDEDSLKELQVAKNLAIKWLTRRSFFRSEIEYKLKKMGVSLATIQEVILFCQKIGVLDDEKLKEKIIEKELRRGRGRAFALAKCRRWIEIKESYPNDPETRGLEKEAIEKVLQKKRIDLSSLDDKGKRKVWRFLLQRGFEKEIVQKVLFQTEFQD